MFFYTTQRRRIEIGGLLKIVTFFLGLYECLPTTNPVK